MSKILQVDPMTNSVYQTYFVEWKKPLERPEFIPVQVLEVSPILSGDTVDDYWVEFQYLAGPCMGRRSGTFAKFIFRGDEAQAISMAGPEQIEFERQIADYRNMAKALMKTLMRPAQERAKSRTGFSKEKGDNFLPIDAYAQRGAEAILEELQAEFSVILDNSDNSDEDGEVG